MQKIKKILAILTAIMVVMSSSTIICFAETKTNTLEDTPIDVVYKYIDLTDKNLHRDGIPSIQKDYDNQELRYSMRSVLKNIPWARKIFVIMPNDKVSFLKDQDEISDKIVYIKDKDLLGFDSASSITFEHNALYKLSEFGVSEHFIYLNDDYFIGRPLKKSDFYYMDSKTNKVVPYCIVSPKHLSNNLYSNICKSHNDLQKRIGDGHKQTGDDYFYQTLSSYKLLYKYFGRKDLTLPSDYRNTLHNATPYTISDLKEIHDMVRDNYEYANECFYAITRNNKQITHQPLHCYYFLNKYNRKINNLDYAYLDLKDSLNYVNLNSLFVINTGAGKYTDADYQNSKSAMSKLFPEKTKYELPEIEDGIYQIETSMNKNKVLDVAGGSTANNANIQLYRKNGTYAQKFKIKQDADGYFTITSMVSGKVLDVENGCKDNGTNVQQYDYYGGDCQKWRIVSDGKGSFYIISKCNDKFLDVDTFKTANGTNIQCWEANGCINQRFKFVD